jgi:hypothetical protein
MITWEPSDQLWGHPVVSFMRSIGERRHVKVQHDVTYARPISYDALNICTIQLHMQVSTHGVRQPADLLARVYTT